MNVKGELSVGSLTVRKQLQAGGISAATMTRGAAQSTPLSQTISLELRHYALTFCVAAANQTYVFSGLHCFWNGETFTGCPSKKVSWGGMANFNPNKAAPVATEPKSLRVPFSESYSGRPLCTVSFQDMAVLARAKSTDGHVDLSVFTEGGCDRKWSDIQSWITVLCHGTRGQAAAQAQ